MAELKLKDSGLLPTNEVLAAVLGRSFAAFGILSSALPTHEIVPQWNYYKDGNVWLCKMLFKKKNLGWLHVYEGYFIVTCYFTEKHLPKIVDLHVSESVKSEFYKAKPAGRLIPMSVAVRTEQPPDDVLTMLLFKKGLK